MNRFGRQVRYAVARNGTLLGLILLVVFFSVENSHFLTWSNAKNIGQAVSVLGVIAIPLALLVITGGIDLSVGSVASMTGILAAKVMVSTGSTLVGVLAGLAFGLSAGVLNGFLVSYLNLNSIVVTLGALSVWGGMALYLTEGQTVAGLPESFTNFATTTIFGIPIEIFVLLVVIALGWFVLNRLPFGRRLYSVGGNERAAFLMGVPVRRVRFLMFVGVGLAASVGGLMVTSKLAAATPTTGQGLEINALTVVLLGGVAFAGGMGRISGVVAGLFFVGTLQNGLVVTGTSQFLQQVFIGLTLIAAVALDDTIRQFAHRAWTDAVGPAAQDPGDEKAKEYAGAAPPP
ncbi:MAG: ribose transport system permease protein [Solirubrobacterales bacterium]|nr:ribose transport system permease protein [Solirubrobacterales bacterium]